MENIPALPVYPFVVWVSSQTEEYSKDSNHRNDSGQTTTSEAMKQSNTLKYTLPTPGEVASPGQCGRNCFSAHLAEIPYSSSKLCWLLSAQKGQGLWPQVSGALTFPVSSPGTRALRKRFLSPPGMLGSSSLSFTGRPSFLSVCTTTRDTDSNAVTVPDQGMSPPKPTCASQPGCPQLPWHHDGPTAHKVLGSCAEKASPHQDFT